MPTDVTSPSLNTSITQSENCDQLVKEFKQCCEENKFRRFLGACSSLHLAMTKCIQKQHLIHAAANRAKGKYGKEQVNTTTLN